MRRTHSLNFAARYPSAMASAFALGTSYPVMTKNLFAIA
jgi:hypothetical protein